MALQVTHNLQQTLIAHYDAYDFHKILKELMVFCSIQMGSFYFEIIKDRQYTVYTNAHARRSCQTVLYHMLEAFVRWLAPILSFTADEIWQSLPGERGRYVFTDTWYPALATLTPKLALDDEQLALWETLIDLRADVNKAIETKRNEKAIAGALEAELTLAVTEPLFNQLIPLADELRFVFIVSKVTLISDPALASASSNDNQEPPYQITVTPAATTKCQRCWHHVAEVGVDPEHPEICPRCVTNLSAPGEQRHYA